MATQVLTYPEPTELMEIEQELLPRLTEDDPVFDEFPIREANTTRLRWEQMDNFQGLQQVRGYNGQPRVVKLPGAKEYDYEPGVYGEFVTLNEKEVTERRALGTWDQPVSIDDLTGRAQQLLLQRRLDRIRYILWTLITAGVFSVANDKGQVFHTDVYPVRTYTTIAPWGPSQAQMAAALPTQDIRAIQLLSRGQSVDFGSGAKIYMNQTTANWLLSNQNPNDFFGRRVGGGNTTNSLTDINAILAGNNIPQVVIYDRHYIDESGVVQLFIPTGKAVLVGRRTNGAALGEYRMTRNFVNPNLEPGAYTRVVDRREYEVPGGIDVHDGHNGGPVIFFPGAVVVITVGTP